MFEETVPAVDPISINEELELLSGALRKLRTYGGAFLRIDFDFDLARRDIGCKSLG